VSHISSKIVEKNMVDLKSPDAGAVIRSKFM